MPDTITATFFEMTFKGVIRISEDGGGSFIEFPDYLSETLTLLYNISDIPISPWEEPGGGVTNEN